MLEREIEDYFCARVRALGGIAEKTVSLSGRGYFDRTAVLPGGRVIFCEVKKPKGGRVAPHQKMRLESYRALGAEVALVKSRDDVDSLLSAKQSRV